MKLLSTVDIIEVIGNTPDSPEMIAIKESVALLYSKETEAKKRYAMVSDRKVIVTMEITLNGVTTFHSNKEIGTSYTEKQLILVLSLIDKQFLREIIQYALTYKSISNKDYQELILYRKKFGPIFKN